jgi:hypothetical protein
MPMLEPKDVVIAVLGASSASGALVLVFLTMIASAIASLSASASAKVKRPFKIGGAVSLAAFMLSIACASLGTWWLVLGQPHRVYLAMVWAFLAQLVLLTAAALQVAVKTIFTQ